MEFARSLYLHADLVVTWSLQGSIFVSTLQSLWLRFPSKPCPWRVCDGLRDLSPSFRTVARWIQHFSDGRESVEDEARTGRSRTSVTYSSVEGAEELIVEDPTITLRFLGLELGVSYGSAHAIIHEQLGQSKRCARWVPHQLGGKLGMAQWWERSLPTNVPRVQILASTPSVGWVCCWFSSLLREVFLLVLQFSPLPKNQHSQILIRPGIR